jgi:hypothetical protein
LKPHYPKLLNASSFSTLRGLHLAQHGGKRGKKRAVVAVARKLGILLHRLWVTAEVYEPLRNHNLRQQQKERCRLTGLSQIAEFG